MMNQIIVNACNALDELADNLEKHAASQQPEAPLVQVRGWHHPAMTPNEVVEIPRRLASAIKELNLESLVGLDEEAIKQIPVRLKLIQQHTVPHVFNGHGHQAIPSMLVTLHWISNHFGSMLSYAALNEPLLPQKLNRRLRYIQARVDDLDIKKDKLESMIHQIESAHSAAESLPSDLADLQEAREGMEKAVKSAKSDIEVAIKDERSLFENATGVANKKLESIEALLQKADERTSILEEQTNIAKKLLDDSEKAYSTAVTKGLSGAFHVRARELSISMWFWVFCLVIALYLGVETGSGRIETLKELMLAEKPSIELILIQLFLSVLSLGAPIWFAWLSTKQISQRFRLAEDYSYKSSVAKAYEGYRREAARVDPALEARLIHSALSRLDEAPLRHVDENYHSTPWQELVASMEFREAVKNIPELRRRFMSIIDKSLPESLKKRADD